MLYRRGLDPPGVINHHHPSPIIGKSMRHSGNGLVFSYKDQKPRKPDRSIHLLNAHFLNMTEAPFHFAPSGAEKYKTLKYSNQKVVIRSE